MALGVAPDQVTFGKHLLLITLILKSGAILPVERREKGLLMRLVSLLYYSAKS